MQHWAEIAGFGLVAVMVLQQLHIQVRQDTDWETTARLYRRRIRYATLFGLPIFVTLTILAFAMESNSNFVKGYAAFSNPEDKAGALLLATFFAGTVRLFFERAADDRVPFRDFVKEFFQSFFAPSTLRERVRNVRYADASNEQRHDAWLWWFLTTNIVALMLILPKFTSSGSDTPEPWSPAVTACAVNLIAFLGYFSWTYVGVFHKMTQVDHFSGRAARLFLGNILDSRVPQQALVIGPADSGKSVFVEAKVTPKSGEKGRTTKVSANTIHIENNEMTVIDSPGENMGDHLMISSHYRADTLVLILDLKELNLKDSPQLMNVNDCHDLARSHDSNTKHYLRALAAATRRDMEVADPKAIYKVRSFLLFLNSQGNNDLIESLPDHAQLRDLAISIGWRFGVGKDDCEVVGGAASSAGEARELLGQSPTERGDKAAWPGRGRVAKSDSMVPVASS